MARRPQSFRQAELRRAMQAAREAGFAVVRVEIVDGRLIVIGLPAASAEAQAPLDKWLAEHAS